MDWKLEGSSQKTESHVLQEQEVTLEDTGEDGISESFQLLQIDVECEHREEMTLPTSNAVWRSVSGMDCLWSRALRRWNVPETPVLRIDIGKKKTGNELGVFRGMSFLA